MTFGNLRIAYDARVLRPREWTTHQSLWAAELIRDAPPGPVLELCSGAGQIGLLGVRGSGRTLVCVDADPTACSFAVANAAAAGMGDLVDVRLAPVDRALGPDERFAVVVADPPWVRREDVGRFPEDPVLSIDGGYDGLEIARTCLQVVADHLMPGGSAVLQVGTTGQAEVLRDELPAFAADLRMAEVRDLDGGVLLHLERVD